MSKQETAASTEAAKTKHPVLTECDVLITRDAMVKVVATVWEHEIPVLKVVHRPENVQVVETRKVEAPDFNVGNEFDRLVRRYDRRGNGYVASAYPLGPEQIAKATGVALTEATEQEQAVIKTRPKKGVVKG